MKFSDTNHASGGVTKELYKILNKRKHNEVTKDGIVYLHRCFTYVMMTNKGNSAAMARDIQCIPYHAFNNHSKCGTWCGFVKDPENYHTIIPGGFHDKELFETLKDIFDRLAANAEKFFAGASSNVNESLNANMASKARSQDVIASPLLQTIVSPARLHRKTKANISLKTFSNLRPCHPENIVTGMRKGFRGL